MPDQRRVLFLCTHNSARSQMAEGLLREMAADRFEVASAGTEQTRVHPLAIEAMKELGIDITAQSSKTLEQFLPQKFDYVITVCDRANESCPNFAKALQKLHWSFDDPSAAAGSEEQRLGAFRKIRDQIAETLQQFLLRS